MRFLCISMHVFGCTQACISVYVEEQLLGHRFCKYSAAVETTRSFPKQLYYFTFSSPDYKSFCWSTSLTNFGITSLSLLSSSFIFFSLPMLVGMSCHCSFILICEKREIPFEFSFLIHSIFFPLKTQLWTFLHLHFPRNPIRLNLAE